MALVVILCAAVAVINVYLWWRTRGELRAWSAREDKKPVMDGYEAARRESNIAAIPMLMWRVFGGIVPGASRYTDESFDDGHVKRIKRAEETIALLMERLGVERCDLPARPITPKLCDASAREAPTGKD